MRPTLLSPLGIAALDGSAEKRMHQTRLPEEKHGIPSRWRDRSVSDAKNVYCYSGGSRGFPLAWSASSGRFSCTRRNARMMLIRCSEARHYSTRDREDVCFLRYANGGDAGEGWRSLLFTLARKMRVSPAAFSSSSFSPARRNALYAGRPASGGGILPARAPKNKEAVDIR